MFQTREIIFLVGDSIGFTCHLTSCAPLEDHWVSTQKEPGLNIRAPMPPYLIYEPGSEGDLVHLVNNELLFRISLALALHRHCEQLIAQIRLPPGSETRRRSKRSEGNKPRMDATWELVFSMTRFFDRMLLVLGLISISLILDLLLVLVISFD